MICPKCNHEIDADSIFCEYCGAKIERNAERTSNEETLIEDRMAEVVRKAVGGVANKYRDEKSKAKKNYPIIKEHVVNAIKKFIDFVSSKYKEIMNKIRNLKNR